MRTIPGELIEFKNAVSGTIDSMKNACENIVKLVSDSVNAVDTVKSEISMYYKSANLDAVLGKFSSLTTSYNAISNAVSGTLKSILTKAEALLAKIDNLDKILAEIASLEEEKSRRINNAKDDEKVDTSDLDAKIKELEASFDRECEGAKTELSSLKSTGGSV